jgi:hypothetical protein
VLLLAKSYSFYLALTSLVAVAAAKGTIFAGLEGDLGFTTAFGADYAEHFSFGTVVVALALAGGAALRATGRFILEAFFSVEFLFGSRESEFGAAIFASQNLVFKSHLLFLL